jgi:hypothetical protein
VGLAAHIARAAATASISIRERNDLFFTAPPEFTVQIFILESILIQFFRQAADTSYLHPPLRDISSWKHSPSCNPMPASPRFPGDSPLRFHWKLGISTSVAARFSAESK